MSAHTVPQHMEALAYGERIRTARAALRAEVKALTTSEGAHMVAALLTDPPEEIASCEIFKLLCWVRRVARQEALRVLRTERVSELRRVRDLTPRERHAVAERLLLRVG